MGPNKRESSCPELLSADGSCALKFDLLNELNGKPLPTPSSTLTFDLGAVP